MVKRVQLVRFEGMEVLADAALKIMDAWQVYMQKDNYNREVTVMAALQPQGLEQACANPHLVAWDCCGPCPINPVMTAADCMTAQPWHPMNYYIATKWCDCPLALHVKKHTSPLQEQFMATAGATRDQVVTSRSIHRIHVIVYKRQVT